MRARNIGYWITTALVATTLVAGGLSDLGGAQPVVETMAHLGYPAYVAGILGVWKLLGAIAILAPGAGRVKEWAYAGIVFDLSGAIVSHASVGDSIAQYAAPIVLLALAVTSWALRPASRRLASLVDASPRTSGMSVTPAHASAA
jgi:hypothetical protein